LVTAAKRCIPGGDGRRQTEPASGFDQPFVSAGIADSEQEEGDRQQEEDHRDGRRRPQRRDEHVGREYPHPPFRPHADQLPGAGDVLLNCVQIPDFGDRHTSG
jgi:hypothetical protein